MKKILFTLVLTLSFFNISFSQTDLDKNRAEINVKKHMSERSKNYSSIRFGEFFSQHYSESLQKIAKTNDTIKYSIVHTYKLKNRTIVDSYFHLNKDYSIIASNTMNEMTKLVTDDLKNNPIFDSILKDIEIKSK